MRKFAAPLVLMLALSSCAAAKGPISQAKLADQLQHNSVGMSAAFAKCEAAAVYKNLTADEKSALAADKAPKTLYDTMRPKFDAAAKACKKQNLNP